MSILGGMRVNAPCVLQFTRSFEGCICLYSHPYCFQAESSCPTPVACPSRTVANGQADDLCLAGSSRSVCTIGGCNEGFAKVGSAPSEYYCMVSSHQFCVSTACRQRLHC